MPEKLLIVDDEPAVCDLLVYNLRKAGYETLVAHDGLTALEMTRKESPDLILLDLMLPGMDGLEVCRTLRKDNRIPVIMLTARGEEIDRVVGLEMGADDYLAKPFSMRELQARIKAVLRRSQPPEDGAADTVLHGPNQLTFDLETRLAAVGSTRLDLTHLEFDLLEKFIRNPERVFTREILLEQIWGYDYAGDTRAVDSAIKRLRAKLREAGWPGEVFIPVRGMGYRFMESGS
jgi:DNA-binding response OmpR family regulator